MTDATPEQPYTEAGRALAEAMALGYDQSWTTEERLTRIRAVESEMWGDAMEQGIKFHADVVAALPAAQARPAVASEGLREALLYGAKAYQHRHDFRPICTAPGCNMSYEEAVDAALASDAGRSVGAAGLRETITALRETDTVEQVAARLGVSRRTIYNWMAGHSPRKGWFSGKGKDRVYNPPFTGSVGALDVEWLARDEALLLMSTVSASIKHYLRTGFVADDSLIRGLRRIHNKLIRIWQLDAAAYDAERQGES